MANRDPSAEPGAEPERRPSWTLDGLRSWADASRSERAPRAAPGPPSFEEALAISEQVVLLSRGEPASALRLAQSLVELTRNAELATQAVARRCRAHMFRRLGRYREALRDYDRSLADFQRLGNGLEYARTVIGTVDALGHMGRDRDAHRLAGRARRVLVRNGEEGRAARLDVNLGLIAERSGRPDEALAAYRRAAALFQRTEAETDLALARFNEANALVTLDRYQEALERYRSSAQTWRALGAGATLARCQLAIGSVLFRMGRLDEAIRLLEETSEMALSLGDPELTATAALDQARAELLAERLEPAASRLDVAIQGFRSLAMHADQAESLALRGTLRSKAGNLVESLDDWQAAGDLYRGIRHARGAAWTDFGRAQTLARLGRARESRALLRAALRTLARRGPASIEMEARLLLAEQELEIRPASARRELTRVARRLRALGDPWIELGLWLMRARSSRGARNPRAAKSALERAYGIARRLQSIAPLEALQATWLGRREQLFRLALDPDLGEEPRWLFLWSERARAPRATVESVATTPGSEPGPPDPDREAFERAREELHWLDAQERERRFDESVPETARIRQLAAWRRKRGLALARLERLGRRLELRGDREGTRAGYAEPDPEAIQAALGPDEALVEYFASDERLLVFVVSRDSIEARSLDGAIGPTREAAMRLRQVWERYRLGSAFVRRHGASLASTTTHLFDRLRSSLLEPVLRRVAPDLRRFIVSPHGWLRTVPFHALLDTPWDVTYVPSGQSLVPRSREERGAAGLRRRPGRGALVVGVASPDAPGAEREAQAVGREYPEPTLLVGDRATPQAVRAAWPSADLIHVAAHGTLQVADPRLSGLHLSGGTWTVHDLRAVPTRARLVVLGSCHSGETVLWGTDHQVGILPALFERSSPVAIVSLWGADDETTGILMSAFHHELASGRSADAALRSARRVVREVREAPYYWAPFITYGVERRGRPSP